MLSRNRGIQWPRLAPGEPALHLGGAEACPGPTPAPALLHLPVFSSVLTSQARVTSAAASRACKGTIGSAGTEVGSLPMAARLRAAGIGVFQSLLFLKASSPPAKGEDVLNGTAGAQGSAGFSGYTCETQRTFASSFCTEPETADSWGDPSLPLPFLFNHCQAASAKPPGTQLITDTGLREKPLP